MGTVIFKLILSGIELSKRSNLVGRERDFSVYRRLNRCKIVVEFRLFVQDVAIVVYNFPVIENQQEPVLYVLRSTKGYRIVSTRIVFIPSGTKLYTEMPL